MTLQGIGRLLTLAQKQHKNTDVTKENVIFWQALLSDIADEVGLAALMVHLRTSPYPPKVSDICAIAESMQEKKKLLPEEAWVEVRKQLNPYQQPHWSQEMIAETVKIMGYMRLCHSTRPGADQQEFIRIYEKLSERKSQEEVIEKAKAGIALLEVRAKGLKEAN